jgi:hypothetical protein
MNAVPEGTLGAVARLRTALEDTAAALAEADLDSLLASDTALQGALNALSTLARADASDLEGFRRELEAAAAALLRCRRLGAGLSDFVRVSLDVRGGQLGYEPARAAAAALTGRGFSQTV